MSQPSAHRPFQRRWRTGDGNILYRGAPESWPVSPLELVELPDGSRLTHGSTYWLESPAGEMLKAWPAPRAYSLEDTLYVYDLCAVCGGKLGRYLWEQTRDWPPTLKLMQVEVDGLVLLE